MKSSALVLSIAISTVLFGGSLAHATPGPQNVETVVIKGTGSGTNVSHKKEGPFWVRYISVSDPKNGGWSIRFGQKESKKKPDEEPIVMAGVGESKPYSGALYVGKEQVIYFHINDANATAIMTLDRKK